MSDAESRTPDEIRADIDSTREELADTVEALSAKTDVKARAHDKTEEVKANVRASADDAASAARDNSLPLAIAGALILGLLIWRRARR